MLCPRCNIAAPGGASCPHCGDPIPEQETFEGQGGHYLRLFILLSLLLFVATTAVASLRSGQPFRLNMLLGSRWFWLYGLIFVLPIGLGVHFWRMLRGEQIRVTDAYIERLSHWGYERVLWDHVTAYRKQILPFRDTRLGRVSRLSRWLTRGRLIARIPPYAYDLIGVNEAGEKVLFRIEPGSVGDLMWLLALVEQHAGGPDTA